MGLTTILAIASFAISLYSADQQRRRQEKAAKEALKRQDEAKGFKIPVEGEASLLPICYGRNLVGGVRVYHDTSNNFINADVGPNGQAFINGLGQAHAVIAIYAVSESYSVPNPSGGSYNFDTQVVVPPAGWSATPLPYNDEPIDATPATYQYVCIKSLKQEVGEVTREIGQWSSNRVSEGLGFNMEGPTVYKASGNVSGTKHELLYIQQAICFDDIEKIYQIDVNNRAYIDSHLVSEGNKDPYKGSLKVHAYTKGGVVDPLIVANPSTIYPSREGALFNDCAYATAVFRLNRDDPQYQGVPSVQFYLEGKKVHGIEGPEGARTLTQTTSYSNNPALCLLDYLLNSVYGRGLNARYIDLETFYRGSLVCDRVVKSAASKDGKLWSEKSGDRDIKLYEANMTLSPAKSIRENTELLLETMGQAELVWSGGTYKLILIYPEVFSQSGVYATNDIVQHSTDAYDKDLYRSLIDDNAAEPPSIGWVNDVVAAYLTDDDITRGSEVTVAWPNAQSRYNHVTVRFLNEAKDFAEDSVSWPPKTGTVNGAAEDRGVWSASEKYQKSDRVTYLGTVYQLLQGVDYVSATNPSLDNTWILYLENSVYNTYLEEDGGMPLETEFFEQGATDFYHALAKAEQRCRFSRDAVVYNLSATLANSIGPNANAQLEPGDIIKLSSSIFKIDGELIRLDSVKIKDGTTIELSGTRYDANMLAWNVADDEIVDVTPYLDIPIEQAQTLVFTPNNDDRAVSSGVLTWSAPDDDRVARYRVQMTHEAEGLLSQSTSWIHLGTTQELRMDLPALPSGLYAFTVIAIARGGKRSKMYSDVDFGWPTVSATLSDFQLGLTITQVEVYKTGSTLPSTPVDGVYNFDVDELTGVPVGWSTTVPVASDNIYVSRSSAQTLTGGGVDNSLSWSVPSLYSDIIQTDSLTPEIVAVLQDVYGDNFGYDNAVGNFVLVSGGVDVTLTDDTAFSVVSQTDCTVAINNTNGSADKGKFSVTNLVGDVGSAVLRCTYMGVDFDQILNVLVSKQPYVRDTTPPLTPTSVTVATGFSNIDIQLNAAELDYAEGHGHGHTIVYGSDLASPTFDDAIELTRFLGTHVTIASSNSSKFTLWFKYSSVDSVESTNPSVSYDGTAKKILTADVDDTPPSIPANMALTTQVQVSQLFVKSSIFVSWDASTDDGILTGYVIRYWDDVDSTRIEAFSNKETFVITDAVPGRTYQVRVAAKDWAGNLSEFNTVDNIVAAGDTNAAANVTNISATAGLKKNIISWDNPVDDSYLVTKVYRSLTSDVYIDPPVYTGRGDVYVDSDVSTAVPYYYYKLTTVTVSGVESAKSAEVFASPTTMDSSNIVEYLAANTIDTNHLVANCITAAEITAGAVTSDKISVTSLSAINANLGTITAGTVTGATIRTASTGQKVILNSANGLRTVNASLVTTSKLAPDGSGFLGINAISWDVAGAVTVQGNLIAGEIDAVTLRYGKTSLTSTTEGYWLKGDGINVGGSVEYIKWDPAAGVEVKGQITVLDGSTNTVGWDNTADNTAASGVNLMHPEYSTFDAIELPVIAKAGTATVTINAVGYFDKSLKIAATGSDAYVYLGASSGDYNIPLIGGKKYIVSFYTDADASRLCQSYIRLDDGTHINLGAFTAGTTWTRRQFILDLTSYASNRMGLFRIDNDAGAGWLKVDGIMVEELVGNNETASAYSRPGTRSVAATLEGGTVIAAGGITLAAGGAVKSNGKNSAASTAAGVFLGYDTTVSNSTKYAFGVGDAASHMYWNADTGLQISGAITGGSISIGTNKFSVDSDGNVSIKSGTTGGRLEIQNDVIKVYDASNVLRVKIGNLSV